MSEGTDRYTILVPSTDGYSDLWKPLLHYLDRYWTWRTSPVLLGANFLKAQYPGAETCAVGDSEYWGQHVLKLLDTVKTDMVLLMMPDYFLLKPVDLKQLDHYLELFEREQLNCLALTPRSINARRPLVYGDCKTVDLAGPYSITLEMAFWRVSALRDALRPEDSPWSLERSARLADEDPRKWCFATKSVFHYVSTGALIRGSWTRRSVRMLTRDGLRTYLGSRAILTRRASFIYGMKGLAFRVVASLQPKLIHRYNSALGRVGPQTGSKK
jgi:hypothetical protein